MDTNELKRTAPRPCAKFDLFMEAAGRPDMMIGGEGLAAFCEERAGAHPMKILEAAANTVIADKMDERDRAELAGELTEADAKRVDALIAKCNDFLRKVYAEAAK